MKRKDLAVWFYIAECGKEASALSCSFYILYEASIAFESSLYEKYIKVNPLNAAVLISSGYLSPLKSRLPSNFGSL